MRGNRFEFDRKAYGYITRINDGKIQVLVFQHPLTEAGIQITKGTVMSKKKLIMQLLGKLQKKQD
jgi:hypothetical protein